HGKRARAAEEQDAGEENDRRQHEARAEPPPRERAGGDVGDHAREAERPRQHTELPVRQGLAPADLGQPGPEAPDGGRVGADDQAERRRAVGTAGAHRWAGLRTTFPSTRGRTAACRYWARA